MEFFKKRSTAWVILAVVMVFSYFTGQARRPADEIHILPSGVYVQDNADILSADTEKYMTQMNNSLVSKAGAEIQVVTINTTGGEDIFDVAVDYGVNTNLSGNCCVFLIAVDDVDAVIVQGQDIMYDFTDSELSSILQYSFTVQDFKDRTLDKGAREAFANLIEMYENYYGISLTGSDHIEYTEKTVMNGDGIIILSFVLFMLLLIWIVSRPRKRRIVGTTVPPHTARPYTPPFISVHTHTRNRPANHTTPHHGGSRTGGFGTSTRGGSFSSSSRGGSFSSSRPSSGSSSRSGGFGGSSSRGGSFGGGSRGGGFRK